jgi:hypothetical protein
MRIIKAYFKHQAFGWPRDTMEVQRRPASYQIERISHIAALNAGKTGCYLLSSAR